MADQQAGGAKTLPLLGCKACITQYNTVEERTRLPELLREAGATYTADLFKDCTHLLAKVPSGDKYKYAKSWGNIHIVAASWLEDSLRLGVRQDESKYAMHAMQATSRSRGRSGRDSAEPQHARHTTCTVPSEPSVQAQAGACAAAGTLGGSRLGATCGPDPVTAACEAGSGLGTEGSTDAGAGGAGQPEAGRVGADPEGLYMDFVRFHPLGVTAGENVELRRLAGACGAIREASLVARVSHVLVGSEPSSAALQAVRDHMAEWRDHVKVVRLQWLRECCAQGRYLEPDAGSCLTAAALMPKGQAPLMPALSLGLNGPNISSSVSKEPWAMASTTSMDAWGDADTRSRAAVDPEPPLSGEQGRALQGLSFTLAAVKGTDAEQVARRLIRSHGGILMGTHSMRLIDVSRVYAICPHGMPEPVMNELCKTCEEFRLVPKGQRGTLLWLKECLRTLKLVPPNVYGQPAFHPMPFNLPLRSFENVRVHVSGYSPDMRAAITSLIEILGGKVTQDFSKVNTYLLVAGVSGKKYEAAVKWGVPAVNELWIITSAYSGQPCDAWAPKARPKGETEGMMQVAFHSYRMRRMQAAAAATATTATNSGSQSIGFEQLPGTQLPGTQLPGTQLPGTQQPPLPPRPSLALGTSVASGTEGISFGGVAAAAGSLVGAQGGGAHVSAAAAPQALGAGGGGWGGGGGLPPPPGASGHAGAGGQQQQQQAGAPKRRVGLLEAMDAISDAEEDVPSIIPPVPPNREVTFTGSGFRVIDSSSSGQQGMPPPPPRPMPPSSSSALANSGYVTHSSNGPLAAPHLHPPSAPAPVSPQHHAHARHLGHPAGQTTAASMMVAPPAVERPPREYEGSVSGEEGSRGPGLQGQLEGGGAGFNAGADVDADAAAAAAAAEGSVGGQVSDSMDSSQPGDEEHLEMAKIQQLLQAAKPAGGLDGSCSQFDEPLLTDAGGAGLTGAEQAGGGAPGALKRGESSVSLGGGGKEISHTSSGGVGTRGTDGDVISKPARRKRGAAAMEPPPPPAHPTHKLRQRGRIVTRRETETQDDGLQVEMSQQVGYDAGQQASERLTRNRGRSASGTRGSAAAGVGGGSNAAMESEAAAKMSLITRLRQKG